MLTKKTKYAIHALSYLGKKLGDDTLKNAKPVLIGEISEKAKVPRKFLEIILLELKNEGILYSKMGKGGGYFLRKKASAIKLAKIIRLFNGPIALLPCASKNFYEKCDECPDEIACGLHSVLIKVRDETLEILEKFSIEDIIKNENMSGLLIVE
jgi:Rrf2 family protein